MKLPFVSIVSLLTLASCVSSTTAISSSTNLNCKGLILDYNPATINDYTLVWSDEFETPGLPDSTKWTNEVGGSGWGNNELQYYTSDDNAWVEEGSLIIEARKETVGANAYTSARMVTRNKGDFKYGKMEIRAKLPAGRGTWPALWMMPTSSRYGGWPRSGEIDIMEHVGYDMNKVHGTVHTDAFNHMKGTQKGASIVLEDVVDTWHTYTLEWLPDRIIISADGTPYFTFKPGLYLNCPDSTEWPFDQSFYFVFNIAVGGNWGGAQGVDETIFPQRMIVDYVRVYQSEFVNDLSS